MTVLVESMSIDSSIQHLRFEAVSEGFLHLLFSLQIAKELLMILCRQVHHEMST